GFLHHAVGLHLHVAADDAVLDHRTESDHAPRTDAASPGDAHVRLDHHVGLDAHVLLDPGGAGIDERDARLHERAVLALAQHRFRAGELRPIVHAGNLFGGHLHRHRRRAGAMRRLDQIGEVVLSLGVVLADRAERAEEEARIDVVDAAVALVDRPLLRRGVLLLHDAHDDAVLVAHHAAIARGILETHGEKAEGNGSGGARELPQRVARQQRHVAVEDEHAAPEAGERLARALHRVRGAELLLLLDEAQRRFREAGFERLAHLLGAVADHDDDRIATELDGALDTVYDEWFTESGKENLRTRTLHPSALARGEDDGCFGGLHGGRVDIARSDVNSMKSGRVARILVRRGTTKGEPSMEGVGSIRVAVVEDDPAQLALAVKLLRSSGFEVVGAWENARSALLGLEASPADVVVVDLQLPDLPGAELTKQIAAMAKPPAIVVLTAHGERAVALEALKAGASGYLLKGTHEDLAEAVHVAANGGSYIAPAIARYLLDEVRGLRQENNAAEIDEPRKDLTKRESEVLTLLAKGLTY